MSIEIIKVITTDEYKEVFPTTAQDTDRIERAINYSFLIIDGVTSGAITKRWNLESTEEGYLTDEQKDLVKKAFVVETNYVLQQNLDLAAQQKSFSFGGVSFSSNKSSTNQLCEAARNYLKEAGLFYKTEFVGPTSSSSSSFFSDLSDYVTYTVADKRYLLTTDTNSTHWNKFIKYNNKGAAEFVSVSAIVGENYYTKDECDSTFATIIALLAESRTRSNKDDELEQYCDNLDATKAAADSVYTKEETYSAKEIDQKIATGTGLYLGWLQNDDQDLPSESEIGTWIVNNWSSLKPESVEKVTNNDYVFIYFSTQYIYWRVKVVTDAQGKVLPSAVSWKKDLEFDDDIIDVKNQVEQNTRNIALKQDLLTTISGYDPTKIQCLYNNCGTLLWSEEKPQSHWWDDVSSLTTADIGTTRKVEVNGVTHTVRLIGVDHDDLADGSGKAHTTWQFTNILSDDNGYSLATFWKDTNDTSTANYDFTNSDIRKALDGEGTGTANWFVKSETTWSSTYSGKSVLDMLPTSLVSKLKSVSKQIATTSSYTVGTYDTKLFIPSYREITATGSSEYAKEEGTTYSYWASHDTNTDRIIQQIKGTDGAITNSTTVTSGAYTETKYSFAGYNSSTRGYGGLTWLRSPGTNNTERAWSVNRDGNLGSGSMCDHAFGVVPCFCL